MGHSDDARVDMAVGVAIMLISVTIIIIYIYALFLADTWIQMLTIKITLIAIVVPALVTLAWIGYLMAAKARRHTKINPEEEAKRLIDDIKRELSRE